MLVLSLQFLQFPKDFSAIAKCLANKSAADCVAFYYDSKTVVDYKVQTDRLLISVLYRLLQ